MTIKGYIFTTYVEQAIQQYGFGTRKMPRRTWGILGNALEKECPDELAIHFHHLDVWKRKLGGDRQNMTFKQYIDKYEEDDVFSKRLKAGLGRIEFSSYYMRKYVDELVSEGYMTKFQTKQGIFTKTYYGISKKGWSVAKAFLNAKNKELVIGQECYIQPE